MANVRRHLQIIKEFGLPAVVAVNRRPGDTNEEVELVKRLALEAGRVRGRGERGLRQGRHRRRRPAPMRSSRRASSPTASTCSTRTTGRSRTRSRPSPRRSTGARDVYFYPAAEQKIGQFTKDGLGELPGLHGQDAPVAVRPIPTLLNAPENFTLPVRDIRAYTGAGWLVPLCGDITQMPGLGKSPAALNVDIDADGKDRRPVLRRTACPWPSSPTTRCPSCSTRSPRRRSAPGGGCSAAWYGGVRRRPRRDVGLVHARPAALRGRAPPDARHAQGGRADAPAAPRPGRGRRRDLRAGARRRCGCPRSTPSAGRLLEEARSTAAETPLAVAEAAAGIAELAAETAGACSEHLRGDAITGAHARRGGVPLGRPPRRDQPRRARPTRALERAAEATRRAGAARDEALRAGEEVVR